MLTLISLPELLRYLAVVRPPYDADLHFGPQRLEELVQLRVNFLQTPKEATVGCSASWGFRHDVQLSCSSVCLSNSS